MRNIISTSAKSTLQIAKMMAESHKAPQCICLYGNLGGGKTVFSKGFAEGLGIPAREIKSPTFNLIRKYRVGKSNLYHCDFYRIQQPDDVITADLEEMFEQKNAYILIEWPERIEELLPKNRINITFKYQDQNTRIITINP